MSSNDYAINLNTGRTIKKSTANYRKLKKLNRIQEIEEHEKEQPPKISKPVDIEEPEVLVADNEHIDTKFDERDFQEKLVDISTDMIEKNLKKIVKSKKLSNDEMDDMLRRMLYKKLCLEQQKPKKLKEKPIKKKKDKKKFKIVESSESESESSESD
jgi:hypothetical protein